MASDNFPESFKKTMATISLIIGEKKVKNKINKKKKSSKDKKLEIVEMYFRKKVSDLESISKECGLSR